MHWFCARRNRASERGTGLQAIVSGPIDRGGCDRQSCKQSFQAAVRAAGAADRTNVIVFPCSIGCPAADHASMPPTSGRTRR
jgi:hypothetical protein